MLDITLGRVSPLSSGILVTAHGREIDKTIQTRSRLSALSIFAVLSLFWNTFSKIQAVVFLYDTYVNI